MESQICSICKTELMGEYCHHCGQRNTGKRANLVELVGDFVSEIFSLQRSVVGTFVWLIKDPFRVVNNYWSGFRNYYHSPAKLAFYALFFIGLHFAFIGNKLLGVSFTTTQNISPQVALMILFLPLLSLTSYLTYIKRRKNFLEHFIAVTYLFSCWVIIFILLDDGINWLFPNLLNYKTLLAFLLILFIWIGRVFSKRTKWTFILLNALLQFIVLIGILIILIGALYFFHPSSINFNKQL